MEPEIVDEILQVVSRVDNVKDMTEIRVLWLRHRLYTEVNTAVDTQLSVGEEHAIAVEVRKVIVFSKKPQFFSFPRIDLMGNNTNRYGMFARLCNKFKVDYLNMIKKWKWEH